ncbi:MAG: VOC family protein [Chloroflexales bacterium]|nr:VOC family protein [Chloroflexales bacterium]
MNIYKEATIYMDGALVYFEIPVADAARAQEFYGSLFGWQFAPGNFEHYFMIPNASPLAGLDGSGQEAGPRVFFGVDDIDAAVARVRALGGQADDPLMLLSGRFARCRDDQGTQFTLWKQAN